MSSAFSLKHWRHRFRPYFRTRPALWVHTRLWLDWFVSFFLSGHAIVLRQLRVARNHRSYTIAGSLCQMCADASTKPSRETLRITCYDSVPKAETEVMDLISGLLVWMDWGIRSKFRELKMTFWCGCFAGASPNWISRRGMPLWRQRSRKRALI